MEERILETRPGSPFATSQQGSVDKGLDLSELHPLTCKLRGCWTRGPQGLAQLCLWLAVMLPVWSQRDSCSLTVTWTQPQRPEQTAAVKVTLVSQSPGSSWHTANT